MQYYSEILRHELWIHERTWMNLQRTTLHAGTAILEVSARMFTIKNNKTEEMENREAVTRDKEWGREEKLWL